MLVILSPAKKLTLTPAALPLSATRPTLSRDTAELSDRVKCLKPSDIARLMNLNDDLAALTHERFQTLGKRASRAAAQPAIHTFRGDTYLGLAADDFDADDLGFAQDHVRILSGLYGLLRPLDAIEPYRLEMGTRLKTDRGTSLYDFWGDKLAATARLALKASGGDTIIVNLASSEYFRALAPKSLKTPVITPVFKIRYGDKIKSEGFPVKKARGMMARFAVRQRVNTVDGLKDFTESGYRFQPKLSNDSEWIFLRKGD